MIAGQLKIADAFFNVSFCWEGVCGEISHPNANRNRVNEQLAKFHASIGNMIESYNINHKPKKPWYLSKKIVYVSLAAFLLTQGGSFVSSLIETIWANNAQDCKLPTYMLVIIIVTTVAAFLYTTGVTIHTRIESHEKKKVKKIIKEKKQAQEVLERLGKKLSEFINESNYEVQIQHLQTITSLLLKLPPDTAKKYPEIVDFILCLINFLPPDNSIVDVLNELLEAQTGKVRGTSEPVLRPKDNNGFLQIEALDKSAPTHKSTTDTLIEDTPEIQSLWRKLDNFLGVSLERVPWKGINLRRKKTDHVGLTVQIP